MHQRTPLPKALLDAHFTKHNKWQQRKGRVRESGREKKDAFSEDLKQMETRRGRKLQKARAIEGEAHTPDCMKA